MKYTTKFFAIAAMATIIASGQAIAADPPSPDEMWDIIQQQQEEIAALKGAVADTTEAVEATAQAVEEGSSNSYGWWNKTSLGGYGEMHLEGGDKDQIDFHRFVLFVGHEMSDQIRLFTEFELEHSLAGEGKPGEVELEQAYIEYDLTPNHHAVAGLWLMPIGIMNDTHEPPTFYGVERNNVEKNIIPTTWWECGFGARGNLDSGIGYDIGAHSGLSTPVTGSNAFKIRNGRQKCAEATAKDFAYSGRLTYTAIPGLELALSGQYQNDLTQGLDPTGATLIAPHMVYSKDGFGLRALYARWDLDSPGASAVGRDEQSGWYVEPSYRFELPANRGDLGVFARYAAFDNNAGDSVDSETREINFGLNFWPHEDVVLKVDALLQDTPDGTDSDDKVNFGVGFQF